MNSPEPNIKIAPVLISTFALLSVVLGIVLLKNPSSSSPETPSKTVSTSPSTSKSNSTSASPIETSSPNPTAESLSTQEKPIAPVEFSNLATKRTLPPFPTSPPLPSSQTTTAETTESTESTENSPENSTEHSPLTEPSTAPAAESTTETQPNGLPLWPLRTVPSAETQTLALNSEGKPLLADSEQIYSYVNQIPTNQNPNTFSLEQQFYLLYWDLTEKSGAETIQTLATTISGEYLLARLGGNEDWMRELLESGPWINPKLVLPRLAALVASQPGMEADPVIRSMASALALAGAQRENNWSEEYLIERFDFFVTHWLEGRLHARFEDMPTWQRRFVAFGGRNEKGNQISSMEYFNSQATVPQLKYRGVCWRSPYRLHNWYGDSVHHRFYYAAFEGVYSSNAEMIETVGGVCGSLSNFGTAAAVANGVPATTMGEPGHCAYAVMGADGHFQEAYSVSWNRGVHHDWYGKRWSDLCALTLSMEDLKTRAQALDLNRSAKLFAQRGETQLADVIWHEALRLSPLEQGIWKDYANFGEQNNLPIEWWQKYHLAAATTFGPELGEVAWTHCHRAQKHIFAETSDLNIKAQLIAEFHQHLGVDWGRARWDLPKALKTQLESIAELEQKLHLLQTIFYIHKNKPEICGQAIITAIELTENHPDLFGYFLASIAEAANDEAETGDTSVLIQVAKEALPAAAAAEDIDTWQAIGSHSEHLFDPIEVETTAFSGELLSSGGILQVSDAGGRWDQPIRHWGVLESCGGFFHTGNKSPNATVVLKRFGRLTGIVLVQSSGNHKRVEGATISVSTDKSQWQPVFTVAEGESIIYVDLKELAPEARYVRIQNQDGNPLHLSQILVYGDPQS